MRCFQIACLLLATGAHGQLQLRALSAFGQGYDNACFHGTSDDYAVVSAAESNVIVTVPGDSGRFREVQRMYLGELIYSRPLCLDSTVLVVLSDYSLRGFHIDKAHRLAPLSLPSLPRVIGNLVATDRHLAIVQPDSIQVAAGYRMPGYSWSEHPRVVRLKGGGAAVFAGDELLAARGERIHRIPMDSAKPLDSVDVPGRRMSLLAYQDGILFGAAGGLQAYRVEAETLVALDSWQPNTSIEGIRVSPGGWVSASAGPGNSVEWTRFRDGAFDKAGAKRAPTGSQINGFLAPGGLFLEAYRNVLTIRSSQSIETHDFPIGYFPVPIAVAGDFLVLSSGSRLGEDRVHLVDFRNRSEPVLAGTFSGLESGGSSTTTWTSGTACGDWIFVAKQVSDTYGFLRTPQGQLTQGWRYAGNTNSLACREDMLIVAGQEETVWFRLQGRQEPRLGGKLPAAFKTQVQGDRLLLTGGSGTSQGASLWTWDGMAAWHGPVPLWNEGSNFAWGMLGTRAYMVLGGSILEFDAATGQNLGSFPVGCPNGNLKPYRDFLLLSGCGDFTGMLHVGSDGKTWLETLQEPALKGRRILGTHGPLIYAVSKLGLECILDESGPPTSLTRGDRRGGGRPALGRRIRFPDLLGRKNGTNSKPGG